MPIYGLVGSNELVVKALLIFGETPQGTTMSEALDLNNVVKINCVSNQSLFMFHVLFVYYKFLAKVSKTFTVRMFERYHKK